MATLRRLPAVLNHHSPKGVVHEAHVSAEPGAASAEARLPRTDEDPWWPSCLEAAAGQGAAPPRCDQTVEVTVAEKTGPFERSDRLRRRQEFRYVARYGRRARARGFVMLAAPRQQQGQDGRVRLGVTVSRRVGTAVVRNRLKRRIRAWFRHERQGMRANLDVVVIAQPAAAALSHQETLTSLEEGARSAGVVV